MERGRYRRWSPRRNQRQSDLDIEGEVRPCDLGNMIHDLRSYLLITTVLGEWRRHKDVAPATRNNTFVVAEPGASLGGGEGQGLACQTWKPRDATKVAILMESRGAEGLQNEQPSRRGQRITDDLTGRVLFQSGHGVSRCDVRGSRRVEPNAIFFESPALLWQGSVRRGGRPYYLRKTNGNWPGQVDSGRNTQSYRTEEIAHCAANKQCLPAILHTDAMHQASPPPSGRYK